MKLNMLVGHDMMYIYILLESQELKVEEAMIQEIDNSEAVNIANVRVLVAEHVDRHVQ